MVEGVRSTVEAARADLGFAGTGYDKLVTAMDGFNFRQLSQCFESVARIKAQEDQGELLLLLGRDYGETTAAADEFVGLATHFLEKYEARVTSDIEQLTGAGELKATQSEIGAPFDDLHGLLGKIEGGKS